MVRAPRYCEQVPGTFWPLSTGPVYVEDEGQGIPIVCVHGLGGSHLNWRPAAKALGKIGRVIALDLPGFGYSPPGRRSTIGAYVDTVTELIAGLGRPALLIGNSMGGVVALETAYRAPQLIEGLVLINPALPLAPGARDIDRETAPRLLIQSIPVVGTRMVARYLEGTTPEVQVWDALGVVCANRDRVPMTVLTEGTRFAAMRRRQPWTAATHARSARSTALRLFRRRHMLDQLAAVQPPTLVIFGAKDRIIPPSSHRRVRELRPDWTVLEIKDCGHCPQIEDPEMTADLIRTWWDESGAKVPEGNAAAG
jgi:pimeloyl-ACP methyl ester carboxylesterase